MSKRKLFFIIFIIPFLFLSGFIWYHISTSTLEPAEDLKQRTFQELKKIHQQKKLEICKLIEQFRQKSLTIKEDPLMLSYFDLLKEHQGNAKIEYAIDVRYVEDYGDFYDILFIDKNGVVFHSIKKESDYGKNLFQSPFKKTSLSQSLRLSAKEQFAEFEFYGPSKESAAFFVVPLLRDKQPIGWFALQLAVNNLNSILTDRQGLGRSGEVYLVNNKKMMLTDSRFFQKSTILREKITTEAVNLAIRSGKGERIIHDYRGASVYSIFEKIDVLGVAWILIAEIDEDEILTRYYHKHKNRILNQLMSFYTQRESLKRYTKTVNPPYDLRVDMNEFKRTSQEAKRLTTFGVSTCSAVAVMYPGKFGYLAHLSPTDEVYMDNWLTSIVLGRKYFDLLGELFAQISHYDLYPFEQRELEVVVVVSHKESVIKIIDTVLAQGLELSSIKLMYNPHAQSADVLLDGTTDKVLVEWETGRSAKIEDATQVLNLATALKRILNYHP